MQNVVENPGGTPKYTYDNTANDSTKDFTVPTGKMWIVHSIAVNLVCTATVGTRNLYVRLFDPSGNLFWQSYVVSPTASQTGSIYIELGGGGREATVRGLVSGSVPNSSVSQSIPPFELTDGMIIRVLDASAVDAAADDMTVAIAYKEYDK